MDCNFSRPPAEAPRATTGKSSRLRETVFGKMRRPGRAGAALGARDIVVILAFFLAHRHVAARQGSFAVLGILGPCQESRWSKETSGVPRRRPQPNRGFVQETRANQGDLSAEFSNGGVTGSSKTT